MKNSALQFLFALAALVLAGAFEEMFPKALGTGLPLLLAVALAFAPNRPWAAGTLCALAAGGLEDALSGLPTMTGASFFAAAALAVRLWTPPTWAAALFCPLFQLWVNLWAPAGHGGVFGRILVSIPLGLVATYAVAWALAWVERKAELDHEG